MEITFAVQGSDAKDQRVKKRIIQIAVNFISIGFVRLVCNWSEEF